MTPWILQTHRRVAQSARIQVLMFLAFATVATGCGQDPADVAIAQLQSADVDVRWQAARQLGDYGGQKVIVALASAVGDTHGEVRHYALQSLGMQGADAKGQLPTIVSALDDPELDARLAAAFAIQAIDPNSNAYVPVLERALLAGEGPVFLRVGEMGSRAAWAVPTLIKLLSHREARIRTVAALTLGKFGPAASEAKSALKRARRDPQQSVREQANRALQQIESGG